MLSLFQFSCRQDNYGFVLRDEAAGLTATVDTADADYVRRLCDKKGWLLTHIFNTHHHSENVGGKLELKERYGCTVVAAESDRDRIPGIDVGVAGGVSFTFGLTEVRVLDVPGHTRGHVAFYLPAQRMCFVGDALFALGCGRLFEGTAAQALASVVKLAALPPDTLLFCSDEYTLTNARFALTVDSNNEAIVKRLAYIGEARHVDTPTVPTTVYKELETNPFLRSGSALSARLSKWAARAISTCLPS
ncbi:hydroxyacylglutathione hydrolase [Pavlovales sp. CCMP2436]|nr:hydroxyacylglutathione hydrolase [Pavlovales sp. CCMP2436]